MQINISLMKLTIRRFLEVLSFKPNVQSFDEIEKENL